MQTLEPCPFCGNEPIKSNPLTFDTNIHLAQTYGYVKCGGCGSRGPAVHIAWDDKNSIKWQTEACNTWNNRTYDMNSHIKKILEESDGSRAGEPVPGETA